MCTEKDYYIKKIRICPECRGTIFIKDNSHDEVYCATCGLVLVAPPVCNIVYPGFHILKIKIPKRKNNRKE